MLRAVRVREKNNNTKKAREEKRKTDEMIR